MRYCKRCLTPSTRPHITFDEHCVCNACAAHASRPAIDWAARRASLESVAGHARSRSRGYDCLIPVSGGKDSTWQVVECLRLGLNPLAVTWKTPARTEIGARNLANLVSLGVDHVDYQVNPRVEKKFMWLALERYGSTAIPMHMALFNIPLRLSVALDIPLVVWGENSAFEYGGSGEERTGFRLDSRWLAKHGVMHGTTARDWVGGGLSERELTPYFGPTDEELERKGVLAIFLGYHLPWDPETSLQVAQAHGFTRAEGARTGYYNYADIDDDFISIHHWLKWYKFGFTRLFDNLSLEIRNDRMTREQAIGIVRERGDQTPRADIARFCAWVGTTEKRFFDVCERFRNREVWRQREGVWMIDDFLVPEWRWA